MSKILKWTAFWVFIGLGIPMITSDGMAQTPETAPAKEEKAPVAPDAAQQTFELMLGAIEDNSYAAFTSRGDETFKTTLTPAQFNSVVAQLAAPFKRGAHTRYLGVLKKGDTLVYLWSLSFGENGDESLAQMSIKNEKVSGFWLM